MESPEALLRFIVQNSANYMPEERPDEIQSLEITIQCPYVESEFGNEKLEVTIAILESFEMKTTLLR